LTYDNGTENTNHLETNRVLGTKSFFCAPFHSWEKGTVENTIGLVRRYLPKKTDLAKVSLKEFKAIERWLNHRPRKCLVLKLRRKSSGEVLHLLREFSKPWIR